MEIEGFRLENRVKPFDTAIICYFASFLRILTLLLNSGKLETGVFCYGQKAYLVETKLACIEMKKAGKSNKVIMDTLSIKNASQAKTW